MYLLATNDYIFHFVCVTIKKNPHYDYVNLFLPALKMNNDQFKKEKPAKHKL